MHKVSKEILAEFESKYGLDIFEGSTIMRLAISNLLSNPPSDDKRKNLIIACKDDETFSVFLKNLLQVAH